ncbi:unnamed protein product, partial [marine sediment metagenome]
KPFLYTLAMQDGYSPCYKVPNVPQTFKDNDSTWTPASSGRKEFWGKMVTLKWGLANSENYVSAWLIKQFNPEEVVGYDLVKARGGQVIIIDLIKGLSTTGIINKLSSRPEKRKKNK